MLKFDFLRFYIIFLTFLKKYGKILNIFVYSKFSFILGDGLFMKKITKIALIFASLFAALTLSVAAEEAGAANVAVAANPQEQNVQQNKNEAQAAQNQAAEQAVANNAAANANQPVQNQTEKIYKATYELQTKAGEYILRIFSALLKIRIIKEKKSEGCVVTEGINDKNIQTISSVKPASIEDAQKDLNAVDEMEKARTIFTILLDAVKGMAISPLEYKEAQDNAIEDVDKYYGIGSKMKKEELEQSKAKLKEQIKNCKIEDFLNLACDMQFKINSAVEDKK